jgi:hypothetical protein
MAEHKLQFTELPRRAGTLRTYYQPAIPRRPFRGRFGLFTNVTAPFRSPPSSGNLPRTSDRNSTSTCVVRLGPGRNVAGRPSCVSYLRFSGECRTQLALHRAVGETRDDFEELGGVESRYRGSRSSALDCFAFNVSTFSILPGVYGCMRSPVLFCHVIGTVCSPCPGHVDF